MDPFLGIDFGTSTSAMAWVNPRTGKAEMLKNAEGEEWTPSQVYFGEDGEAAVGKAADLWLEDDPEAFGRLAVSVKRHLASNASLPFLYDGRRARPTDVTTLILAKLKTDAETLHFHQPVRRAAVTVPAAFNIIETDRIRDAALAAGFEEIVTLEEPVAAALAYARDGMEVGRHILVYDLGGGTFDVALIRVSGADDDQRFERVLPPSGDARLGGDDFDRALYDYLDGQARETHGIGLGPNESFDLHVLQRVRRLKETLSTQNQWTISFFVDGKARKVDVTRQTFEDLIDPWVQKTMTLTETLVRDARDQGCPVETAVLIGGSTQVPLVHRRLTESEAGQPVLPVSLHQWQHRGVGVALGAAYHAWERWGDPNPEDQRRTRIGGGTSRGEQARSRPPVDVLEGVWPQPGCVFRDCGPDGRRDETLPEMVVIPAGEFWMGSPDDESGRDEDEGLSHLVRIARPFAMARYAVTQREWVALMGENPSTFEGGNQPADSVSWNDCQTFINALNEKLGLTLGEGYRLPSEAEWEYACRAGTDTPFWWGQTIMTDQANYNGNDTDNGTPEGTYRRATLPVRTFQPNPFGLYQMHGNVWEWVEDCWHDSYCDAPTDGSAWTTKDLDWRVLRGGSWVNGPGYLRSAYRGRSNPINRSSYGGFRIARTLP